jgi:flavin reductase (DIM6/NTAB) family NADH-FMN oxidoreductase RutF
MPKVTPDRFRSVFSRLATAVLVMTTTDDRVGPHGMTVNAVTSVSLDPFLVLVCVRRGTVMERLVGTSGTFALSVLPEGRSDLSAHFADSNRPAGAAQFAGVETRTMATGSPVLDCCVAWADCDVWATYDGGDHRIVVGEVADLGLGLEDAAPLVYYRSAYETIRGVGNVE